MLSTIIAKELKAIISSPKFAVTFAACSVLILLSVWVGIQDYRAGRERVEASYRIHEHIMKNITWERIHTRAFRLPDPMQIFVSGVNNDIGRLSDIQASSPVKLTNSVFSDDTIFAVFRFIDFAFIVQMVLSLIAILFTYDAINGEREGGTLQLTFSNPVPRARFILGKLVGSWLGLVIPLAIPILLAILLVLLSGVPMTPLHWQKLGALLGVSLLLFTFFIALGLLTSAVTRRSATSFLAALVAWVLLVFIVPRASVMSAGQIVTVPGVAEMETKQAAFNKDQSERMSQELNKRIKEIFAKVMAGAKTPAERQQAMKKAQEEYTSVISEINAQRQKDMAAYAYKLNEERRNQQARQEQLAFSLARMSPASAFRLAVMNVSETDIGMKRRTEDAMIQFRAGILQLGERKTRERKGMLGAGKSMLSLNTVPNGDGTITANIKRTDNPSLDYSEVPKFVEQPLALTEVTSHTIVDVGILALFSVVAFSATFVSFLRYDVR